MFSVFYFRYDPISLVVVAIEPCRRRFITDKNHIVCCPILYTGTRESPTWAESIPRRHPLTRYFSVFQTRPGLYQRNSHCRIRVAVGLKPTATRRVQISNRRMGVYWISTTTPFDFPVNPFRCLTLSVDSIPLPGDASSAPDWTIQVRLAQTYECFDMLRRKRLKTGPLTSWKWEGVKDENSSPRFPSWFDPMRAGQISPSRLGDPERMGDRGKFGPICRNCSPHERASTNWPSSITPPCYFSPASSNTWATRRNNVVASGQRSDVF